MAKRFQDKTALVSGGSRGIGKAVAERLLQEGAKVYVIGRSKENLDKIKAVNPLINTIKVDVSDWDQTKTAVEQIGVVDLLVNNAGILYHEKFVDLGIEKFEEIINTNFKSAFNITQIMAHGLISAGRPGAVVNIFSVGGLKTVPESMPYCVSKAMMDMLTKVTAIELGPYNIRVNSVNPTATYTDMTKDLFENEQIMPMILSQHPLGKVAKVDDIMEATIFLLSEDAAMITGSTLAVDGGLLLK
ncbi:hypothetical protein KUTeg_021823 [Tegillarca granosa]|uniref:L-xylulose reductase n=1 Tax=Tegillarca granosa TaxID=220873 RepID=A0ABQ9E4G4_TEGGR|nr:hypothetical protein KUTeg_021823 [Tegillarca granosa]